MEAETDRRRVRGDQTRRAILEQAVDVASVEGLEGLSIGRLAASLGVSKSGLFAHFGSKEDLQLATVDAAAELFQAEVWDPVADMDAGLPRLEALVDSWLSYFSRGVFAGGCFFANVQHEFDSRPGPVRDRIAKQKRRWTRALLSEIEEAQSRGELRADVSAEQLAFELDSFPVQANSRYQLSGDAHAFELASVAVKRSLESAKA